MKPEIIGEIVENAMGNSVIPLSREEIESMIQKVEKKLGKELTGYVKEDKPYNNFYSKEMISRKFPKVKIVRLILDNLKHNQNDVAIICGREITKGELQSNILIAADALKQYGIKEKDIITICSPSTPELIYYFLAANLIGAICRPIDPISSKKTTRANLEVTKSKLLITLDLNYKNFKGITDNLECKVIGLSLNDTLPIGVNIKKIGIKTLGKIITSKIKSDCNWITHKDFIKESVNKKINVDELEAEYCENQVYCIYSSSGTSGMPKGISSLDSSMLASVLKQIDANYTRKLGDKIFNPMPSYSTYFWNDLFYAFLTGIPVVLCPLFSVEKSVDEILNSQCSIILLGPIILERLNNYIDKEIKKGRTPDLSHITHIFSGGDILRYNLEKTTNENLKKCGSIAKVENGYGISEAEGPAFIPNGATGNTDAYCEGSVGVPMAGDDIAIFKYDSDCDTRNIESKNYDDGLKYYEIGEICLNVNNPEIFVGYYNDPESTALAKIAHKDGSIWYHTGDLGYMDPAGRMFCSGRKYGMIVRNGHKIWTSKINSVVRNFPQVIDCETIGIEDIQEQEVPILFVVFSDLVSENEKQNILNNIKLNLQKEFDALHIPKYIKELDEIPRNLLLKSKLSELRKLAEKEKNNFEKEKNSKFKRY